MPSLNRRRELDGRGQRFESEIRSTELQSKNLWANRERLYTCSRCGHAFEERSRHCPRCDTKSMGYLTPIPEQYREEANRKAIARAQRRVRGT